MHWFTSDWHLNHLGQLPHRPGSFESVKELDELILNNVLELVKPGNNLYFLGDLGWKMKVEDFMNLFNTLKKARINFHWVEGNHDKNFKHGAIKWRGTLKDITIEKQPITLCHYPMRVWNRSHHGAWQLFGHIHKSDHTDNIMNYEALGKQLNMNVEFWDYKPLSFEQVVEQMKLRPDNFDLIRREKNHES